MVLEVLKRSFFASSDVGSNPMTLNGSVVLFKKNERFETSYEEICPTKSQAGLSLQLVSSTVGDPNDDRNRGVVGEATYYDLKRKSEKTVMFNWKEEDGIPGAVIVELSSGEEFFLMSVAVEDFPGKGRIFFDCRSWVYPKNKYTYKRIFFTNTACLPGETPAPLKPYRDDELLNLRGKDVTGQLNEWDRVYDYAYYNDLGDPDAKKPMPRPVLGGSADYPYPRRGKTGRPTTNKDPESESLVPQNKDIYVPRDERFGNIKQSDFRSNIIRSFAQAVVPILKAKLGLKTQFKSYNDVLSLYEKGLPLAPGNNEQLIKELAEQSPMFEIRTEDNQSFISFPRPENFYDGDLELASGADTNLTKELAYQTPTIFEIHMQGLQSYLWFPRPQIIQADEDAWRTDQEFAREMLAGVNPVIIRRLEVFPPISMLDPRKYGNQHSKITAADIEDNLEGLTVDEALKGNKLFLLDHHDALMPYVNLINSNTENKIYATRTLLLLREDSTLKPLAIELSLPHPDGMKHGAVSKVYTPPPAGEEVNPDFWPLAKACATVNDSGVHQLLSHWLNTHAVIEPFIIATNRHLSVMHPVNKLLTPHFRDTMNINALARQVLVNADGIVETTIFPAKYSMEMSSKIYKSWNFVEQALPADLIERGVAIKDSNNEIQLLIKDYPYAVDGLPIWRAMETWVKEYCAIYYPNDAMVQGDVELQKWWTEIREVGHGDLKSEPWWPAMQSVADLTQSCTILIWVASAFHAAVNFGQYPYGGFHPNRPTISRHFMPEPGTPEYDELKNDPQKAFFQTITSLQPSVISMVLNEILSIHSPDEVYLGQNSPDWTADRRALDAFEKFGATLRQIEDEIKARNKDESLKNRNGPVKMPYALLQRSSEPGMTAMGIPNSVSI